MSEDFAMIHIRLPRPLIRKIDHLGIDLDLHSRANTIRRIIEAAFTDEDYLLYALQLAGDEGGQTRRSDHTGSGAAEGVA